NTMVLTDVSLDPGAGFITLGSVEQAHLVGGGSPNILEASVFTGRVTLEGGGGNDLLVGGSNSDSILGQGGDDTLTGELGSDKLDGGFGDDLLSEEANTNFTATNNTLTGLGSDTLAGIDRLSLTVGVANNLINASAFNGPTTLAGASGNDT